MKLTIFIGDLSGGGAERVVCNLSNFLVSKRHQVEIVTMVNNASSYQLSPKVKRVPLLKGNESNNFVIKNLIRIVRLRRYIKKSDTDIYLSMLPWTINLILSQRKLIKAPIVISERGDPNIRYNNSKLQKWLMKKLYPLADGFVFQTTDAREYYENIVNNNATIIPNAINEDFVGKPYTIHRKKTIVSVGRFTEQKNFSLLIKAFSNIASKYPEYNLIIYGEGPQREKLQNLVTELNISNRVQLPGYVKNIGEHIIDSSLFVLSSNYEGMPNALMEAMALGLPCISTDCPVGGPKFLIEHGVNGILVPVNNVEEMSAQLNNLLSNFNFRKKLGINAKKITNTLSYNNVYEKWEKFLKQYVSN